MLIKKKDVPTILLENYDKKLLKRLKEMLKGAGYRVIIVNSLGAMEAYLKIYPEIGLVAASDQVSNALIGERKFLNISDFLNDAEEMSDEGALRFLSSVQQSVPVDERTGGIDLKSVNKDVQVNGEGGGIKIHLDPDMFARLQNVSGFVPVMISIRPMNNLREFLDMPSV